MGQKLWNNIRAETSKVLFYQSMMSDTVDDSKILKKDLLHKTELMNKIKKEKARVCSLWEKSHNESEERSFAKLYFRTQRDFVQKQEAVTALESQLQEMEILLVTLTRDRNDAVTKVKTMLGELGTRSVLVMDVCDLTSIRMFRRFYPNGRLRFTVGSSILESSATLIRELGVGVGIEELASNALYEFRQGRFYRVAL